MKRARILKQFDFNIAARSFVIFDFNKRGREDGRKEENYIKRLIEFEARFTTWQYISIRTRPCPFIIMETFMLCVKWKMQ